MNIKEYMSEKIDKTIEYNLNYIKKNISIKKLLSGWETVDRFGFFADSFSNNVNGISGTPYQPIYILKK